MIKALIKSFSRWWQGSVVDRYENTRVGDANYLTKREKMLLDNWDNELLITPLGNEKAILLEKAQRLGYKPKGHAA